MSFCFTFKNISILLIGGALSACSTPAQEINLATAGAPSDHVPQSYPGAAETTSALGGSSATSGGDGSSSTTAISGSITLNTGRLELIDGAFRFVDLDGPESDGYINDAGNDGFIDSQLVQGYDYVFQFAVCCSAGTNYDMHLGVLGLVTAPSDLPSAGSASYTGEAYAEIYYLFPSLATGGSFNFFDKGISQVDVDFASGTASVLLGSFARITQNGGAVITPATAPFDQIQGSGLVLSGGHLTGGDWATYSGGSIVNVVGANGTTSSNGTFFGYDPSISAPDEVGGVVSINGDEGYVVGVYIAD